MATKKKAASARKPPAAKHVNLAPEQVIHIHAMKGEKELGHYIAQASADGVVSFNAAPEPDAPVQDPSPVSGT